MWSITYYKLPICDYESTTLQPSTDQYPTLNTISPGDQKITIAPPLVTQFPLQHHFHHFGSTLVDAKNVMTIERLIFSNEDYIESIPIRPNHIKFVLFQQIQLEWLHFYTQLCLSLVWKSLIYFLFWFIISEVKNLNGLFIEM